MGMYGVKEAVIVLEKHTGRLNVVPMDTLHYVINGIQIVFGVTRFGKLKLLHFSRADFDERQLCRKPDDKDTDDTRAERVRHLEEEGFQLVQVSFSGYDRPYEKQGNKHVVTAPGYLLLFDGIEEGRNDLGDTLTIRQHDDVTGAQVTTLWQFYDGLPILRAWNTVTNTSSCDQTLELLSGFFYGAVEKDNRPGETAYSYADEKMSMAVVYNSWQKELNVRRFRLQDLGMGFTQPRVHQRTSRQIEVTNTGNWSAKSQLPMGYLQNDMADNSLFFQIEHSGSWHYEIGDQCRHFYLMVSGPNELQNHWSRVLHPGDSFTTVPVAVGVGRASMEDAIGTLTRYRRLIRRPNSDNERLPIIFNDYMNCLFGDPTTEREWPMIDAAAKAGCDYYVIDAGWYAEGNWWDSVGEWQVCEKRFPGGLRKVTDRIREKGMIPGLWLEIEVMGIRCKLAGELPDECFFMRHGKRVYDRSRYQLDFRHPLVIQHVNGVIDRLVREYGVGYFKMDYNIEPGIGTEVDADSAGDGMFKHEQAYLRWLDSLYVRYPDLVIENCSSGGLRMDYAMLARNSIQSTSDQEDYATYAVIAANACVGVTPEQSAVWSYPMEGGDREETVFNMVNTLLGRVHQSGHLAKLEPERFALVKEALDLYRSIRADIRTGVPYWPMDVASYEDQWLCGGLRCGGVTYLAVWRREGGPASWTIDLSGAYPGEAIEVDCIYPADHGGEGCYDPESCTLKVCYPQPKMARLFRIRRKA